MKKKLTLVVSLLLVLALSIGGTIAWLTDTETVTNTFTMGNVDITLVETTGVDYKFVPGKEIEKDPKVTVVADSEACYVYVEIKEEINFTKETNYGFSDYFTYDIADGWEQLKDKDGNDVTGVYYKTVDAETAKAGTFWYVLKGSETYANGCVSVSDKVTKDMIDVLDMSKDKEPTLTITAYAIQSEGTGSAAEAWEKFE